MPAVATALVSLVLALNLGVDDELPPSMVKEPERAATTTEKSHFYVTGTPLGVGYPNDTRWGAHLGVGRFFNRGKTTYGRFGLGVHAYSFIWNGEEEFPEEGDGATMETHMAAQARFGGGGTRWMAYAIVGFGLGRSLYRFEPADAFSSTTNSIWPTLGPSFGAGGTFMVTEHFGLGFETVGFVLWALPGDASSYGAFVGSFLNFEVRW